MAASAAASAYAYLYAAAFAFASALHGVWGVRVLASQAAVRLSKLTEQHGTFFFHLEKVAGLFPWRSCRHCKLDAFLCVCVRVLMCSRNEISMCADK